MVRLNEMNTEISFTLTVEVEPLVWPYLSNISAIYHLNFSYLIFQYLLQTYSLAVLLVAKNIAQIKEMDMIYVIVGADSGAIFSTNSDSI